MDLAFLTSETVESSSVSSFVSILRSQAWTKPWCVDMLTYYGQNNAALGAIISYARLRPDMSSDDVAFGLSLLQGAKGHGALLTMDLEQSAVDEEQHEAESSQPLLEGWIGAARVAFPHAARGLHEYIAVHSLARRGAPTAGWLTIEIASNLAATALPAVLGSITLSDAADRDPEWLEALAVVFDRAVAQPGQSFYWRDLINGALPLVAAGLCSQIDLEAVLAAVGVEAAERETLGYFGIRGRNSLTATLERLLPLVESDNSEIASGAAYVLGGLCWSAGLMRSSSETTIAVSSLRSQHRRLMAMGTAAGNRAALGLFVVRRPTALVDWIWLKSAVTMLPVGITADALGQALLTSAEAMHAAPAWELFLREALQHPVQRDLGVVLRTLMLRLKAGGGQSISSLEMELGLPLIN